MRKIIKIFADGGARGNPGPAAVGYVIKNDRNEVIVQRGKCIGRATNNVAEYKAVIAALEEVVKTPNFKRAKVYFFVDSQLVVKQLTGEYKIKNPNLKELAIEVKRLEKKISEGIVYQHISREKNFQADQILNRCLDKNSLSFT